MTGAPDRLTAALADRYRIERELGQGGMATVYLAEDLKHHRKVALKVLRPQLAALLGAERFLREIEITANLQHPHILPLFDSGEAGGFLFYVMPYVEGETLRDRIKREGRVGVEEALRITVQLARALEAAHREGILHRDIKPENVLVRDGEPLIADFGIAQATRAGDERLTEAGLSLGTVLYMSPEQAAGERDLDARSDVYALACVLYEMLSGQPPHAGDSARAVITARLLGPPDLQEVRRTTPALAAVLAQALAPAPAGSPPDHGGVRRGAAGAARGGGGASPRAASARRCWLPSSWWSSRRGGWSVYGSQRRAQRAEILARIERLNDSADVIGAFLLAERLGRARWPRGHHQAWRCGGGSHARW